MLVLYSTPEGSGCSQDANKLHCTNDGHIRILSYGSLLTVWPGQHTGGLKLPLPAEKRSLSGGMAHYALCQQDAFPFRAGGKVTELRMVGMLLGTGL
jgi:hypothetical protein